MLKVEGISKYYGDFKALDNLSFSAKQGEIFGLLGVNGAGNTTTFRMIMGLLDCDMGKITLNDKPVDYSVTNQIGFLTEERSLLTKLTVFNHAVFFGSLKGMTKDEVNKRLDELLDRFEIPEYKNKKIKELSKGNQQKVQFIISILNNPKLLILDEPFAGLDPYNIELFKSEIIRMSNEGSIIIFSSHRMDHVEMFCKKLVILVKGKTVLEGYIKDIKKTYRKMNIFVKGNLNKSELLKIKGVLKVIQNDDEFEIKIEREEVVDKVFKYLKDSHKVSKFMIEEASLNEIFLEKVGEVYEK